MCDEIVGGVDLSCCDHHVNKYTVYIGSHGDRGATDADIVLPGACYTEKNGLYMNTEGRLQATNRAVFPPGDARDNWKIIVEISKRIKKLHHGKISQNLFRSMHSRISFDKKNYQAC